jgi:diguanylate cyclase (GGDEF)-like protein
VLALLSQRTGFRFLHVSGSNEELPEMLSAGEIDFIALSPLLPEEAFRHSVAYLHADMALFSLKSPPKTSPRIGLVPQKEHWVHVRDTYPDAQFETFDALNAGFEALLDKEVDLLYAPKASVAALSRRYSHANLSMVALSKEATPVPLHLVTTADDLVRYGILSKAVRSISEEEKQAIANKWLPMLIEKEADWSWVWEILSIALAVLLILLYKHHALARLNKKLNAQEKALRKTQDILKDHAHKDALTGLHNRRYFNETAKKLLDASLHQKNALCLMLLDIDYFKRYNDTYGHAMGDEALRVFAKTLKSLARETDVVTRFGGEEFILLLPDTSLAGAKALAERIRESIETLHVNHPIPALTVSIGVTQLEGHVENIEVLWKKADEALYRAKGAGKNRVEVF